MESDTIEDEMPRISPFAPSGASPARRLTITARRIAWLNDKTTIPRTKTRNNFTLTTKKPARQARSAPRMRLFSSNFFSQNRREDYEFFFGNFYHV